MNINDLLNENDEETYQPEELFYIETIKGYSCMWNSCGKEFTRKSDLKRHTRIHTGDRPFQCDWDGCGKRFIQRSALTVHYRTHTGERPHLCEHPTCNKSFSDSSALARHRRVHTGNRPYPCNHCSKSFTRRSALSRHKLICPDRNCTKSLPLKKQYETKSSSSLSDNQNEDLELIPNSITQKDHRSLYNTTKTTCAILFPYHPSLLYCNYEIPSKVN
ncbi:unnamed protein product [Cunninghamella blakesleeana]